MQDDAGKSGKGGIGKGSNDARAPAPWVRRMQPGDRAAVERLLSEPPPIDLGAELDKDYSELWLAGWTPNDPVAVALVWRVFDHVELIDIRTRPSDRRRGVARALLARLIEHATESGAKTMFLEVRRGNVAALSLYRSLGFELNRERLGYYGDGEDGLELRRTLDPRASD